MAHWRNHDTTRGVVQLWTNATQPTDPTPAGYSETDDSGQVTSQRALTANETAVLAAQDAIAVQDTNQATLQQRARAALTANTNFVSSAKPSTAAAQASQAYDQAVTLSKECSGVIRLLLNLFDTTAGT